MAYTPDQSAFTETRLAVAGPPVVLSRSAGARGVAVQISSKSGITIVASAVADRAGHFEVLEIVGLEAQPFGGHEVPRAAHLAVAQKSIAVGSSP